MNQVCTPSIIENNAVVSHALAACTATMPSPQLSAHFEPQPCTTSESCSSKEDFIEKLQRQFCKILCSNDIYKTFSRFAQVIFNSEILLKAQALPYPLVIGNQSVASIAAQIKDKNSQHTLLHEAAKALDSIVTEYLISGGAAVNGDDNSDKKLTSPLYLAVARDPLLPFISQKIQSQKRYNTAFNLLKNKADVTFVDTSRLHMDSGKSVLESACYTADPKIVELILKSEEAAAIVKSNTPLFQVMLRAANDPLFFSSSPMEQLALPFIPFDQLAQEVQNTINEKQLHKSRKQKRSDILETAKLLIKNGFFIDKPSSLFPSSTFNLIDSQIQIGLEPLMMTPLQWACLLNSIEMVQLILTQNVRIDQTDPHNQTALHIAAQYGDSKMYNLLIKHGADNTIKDTTGKTPAEIKKEKMKLL